MPGKTILRHGARPSAFLEACPEPYPPEGAAPRLLAPDGGVPLPDLLERARALTDSRFGRKVLLYAPCYLSSFCVNQCEYCGFAFKLDAPRRHLGPDEALAEVGLLAARRMKRILLVAGEHPARVNGDYIAQVVESARRIVPEIDLEVAAASTADYRAWARAGAGGVTCYQETYDSIAYERFHPCGPKRSYAFRIGVPERAGAAGMARLGLGVLLGLADPVRDVAALIRHAMFLQRRFPRARITVSLPRLRPAVPSFRAPHSVDDESLIRFYAVLRLALPDAGLIVSTREPAGIRRRLLEAGITQMSAGSVTSPGGYGGGGDEDGQFQIADHRSADEVASDLARLGYGVIRESSEPSAPDQGALALGR